MLLFSAHEINYLVAGRLKVFSLTYFKANLDNGYASFRLNLINPSVWTPNLKSKLDTACT